MNIHTVQQISKTGLHSYCITALELILRNHIGFYGKDYVPFTINLTNCLNSLLNLIKEGVGK